MLLCDSAQVADGKLYILGGGWSMTGPDPVPSAVALKIDVALAVNLGPIPLAAGTRFAWRLTIDGEALPGASLGFTTRPRPPQVAE